MNGTRLIEALTTAVLVIVAALLSWMIVASFAPAVASWMPSEVAVIVILVVLTAALLLVSAEALWQTRSRDLP
jgi:hypothetical protein